MERAQGQVEVEEQEQEGRESESMSEIVKIIGYIVFLGLMTILI